MSKRMRQYLGILAAAAMYLLIHEGAHALMAISYGAFKEIRFLGLGMQIDVYAERMSEIQMGLFCLSGAVATLLTGWLLVLCAKRICRSQSKLILSVLWYCSLAMLLLDPLYLSVLCGFFGGGDLNGISLLAPEPAVRLSFGVLGAVHGVVVWNYLLKVYTKAFENLEDET